MKIRGRFLLGGLRGSLARFSEARLFSFQSASVRTRGAERRARSVHRSFGGLGCFRGLSFGRGERFEAQALADAVELAPGEIVGSLEPLFEARAFAASFTACPLLGFDATRLRPGERRLLARRLPFGFAELARAPIDLFAP